MPSIAALEAADGDGALPPIDILPPEVDQLADPEPVQERHQRDHMVAVPMTVALQRLEQRIEFVLSEGLPHAIVGLASTRLGYEWVDFPRYGLVGRFGGALQTLAFFPLVVFNITHSGIECGKLLV